MNRYFVSVILALVFAFAICAAPANANATVTTVPVSADTYVKDDLTCDGTCGTAVRFSVEGETPERHAFLRFNATVPAGETVTDAKLRLFTDSGVPSLPSSVVNAYSISGSWTETGMTWANQPTFGSLVASNTGFGPSAWEEWNVTSAVAGSGTVEFGLKTPNPPYVGFKSREGGTANDPELVITSSGTDTTNPVVTLTAPSAGTVSGTINLAATATDNSGVVSSAKWFYSGAPAVEIGYDGDATGGWTDTWDTTTVADGVYTLFAKANDPSGNWGTSPSVNVTVDNVVEPPPTSKVVAAVGDICGGSTCTGAPQETAQTVAAINPYRLLGLGDYQYQNAGTNGATFQTGYQSKFGSLANITIPTFGATHDTCDGSGSWECYPVSYFNSNGAPEVRGLLSDHQWGYSVDIGNWHVVNFNYRTAEGGSVAAVTADLDAHPSQCLLAISHAPVIGSPSSSHPTNEASAFRQTLVDHNVDVVLGGHQHYYERNVDPAGFTAITNGLGGVGHYTRTSAASTAVAYNDTSFGVVKATLGDNSWSTEFVKNASAAAFTDTASGDCQ